jgi:hypothetical protein
MPPTHNAQINNVGRLCVNSFVCELPFLNNASIVLKLFSLLVPLLALIRTTVATLPAAARFATVAHYAPALCLSFRSFSSLPVGVCFYNFHHGATLSPTE